MSEPLRPSFTLRVPPGEERRRRVCDHCGFIDYVNPRIVAGAVIAYAETGPPHGAGAVPLEEVQVLLCKRAIHPRKGYWTLPAGFMAPGETTREAARRETREEACAEFEHDGLLAIFDVVHREQVHIFQRGRLTEPRFAPGPESLDVKLFGWAEIPWEDLAFTTVHWALRAWLDSREREGFAPYGNEAG